MGNGVRGKNIRTSITSILTASMFSLIFPYSFAIAQQTPIQFYQVPPSAYSPFQQLPQYPYQGPYANPSQSPDSGINSAATTVPNYDNFESGTYALHNGQYSPNGKWLGVYGQYYGSY